MATTTIGTGAAQFEDATEVEALAAEFEDFDYDDDEDDDDDYFFDDHDGAIGGGGGGGGGSAKMATINMSSNNSKMNFSHSVSNTVSKMQSIEVKKRVLVQMIAVVTLSI